MRHVRVLTALALLVPTLGFLAGQAQAIGHGDPDLVVVNVTTDPEVPTPGDEADVFATIRNEGEGESNTWTYNFTHDGQELGEGGQGDPLATEDTAETDNEQTVQASTAWSVEAGQHTLQAIVNHSDDDEDLGKQDSDPSNDVNNVTFHIGTDLAVASLEVDPTETIEGQTVDLTADVENLADSQDILSDTNETFHVEFLANDESVATVPIDGLAAGDSTTVTAQWQASQGKPTVTAEVDGDQIVHDQDRTNNEGPPVTLDVRPARPDLAIGSASYSPDPAEPGRTVTFEVPVLNNGHADAGGFDVQLRVGEEVADTVALDGVAQGEQANATLSWDATAGLHDVEFVADPNDDVTEEDSQTGSGNNVGTLQLAVGSDLLVRDFEIQPPQPRGSDRVRFSVEIGNEGLDVNDPFDVSFRVDGEAFDSEQVTALANGDTTNKTSVAWEASVGDHNVSVILDPDGNIPEVDRTNNRQERQLTVGEPEPDVAVVSAVLDPATVDEGDDATLRAQIENKGARAADAFTVLGSIDDEEIGDGRIDGLDPGERTTVDLGAWTASSGVHELRVQADTDDELDEAIETNNELVRRLGIGPNLEALDLSLSPNDPEPGTEVTALALVQNNGTVATPAVNVSFTQEGSQIRTQGIDALEPNQQATAEITFTPTRSGELQADVDADDAVDEFDEDDNRATASLELLSEPEPPDLTVRSVTLQGEASNGEEVQVTAEIANEGSGPAPETLVDFRIDGSSIGSPVTIGGLDAGDSKQVTSSPWTVSREEQQLEVRVDPDDQVGETDETNNAYTLSVEGGPVGVPSSPVVALAALLGGSIAARGLPRSHRKRR